MRVAAAAATDIGLIREGNEDSYLVVDPLFAVADGMGGHRGGEVASQLALETIEDLFRSGESDLAGQVREANRVVFERSVRDRRVAGMGTTLTAVLVEEDHVRVAHVGDSRAYLFRAGELRPLTEDHTLVHRMLMEGEITEEEAEVHPHRSVLTRALGVDASVDVDEDVIDLRAGDRLLLCTDGLTAMITPERIRELLAGARDPQDAADRLVRAANAAGGVDNTTVVVVDFAADDPSTTPDETSHADGPASPLRLPVHPQPRSAEPPALRGARGSRGSEKAWRDGLRVGPVRRRRSFLTRRGLTWVGIVAAALIVGLVGLRVYVDRQWYVGVADGHVAIYRGIPAEFAGFHLHHVVVETTISAAAVQSLPLYRHLSEGITVQDQMGATALVEQIRLDVEPAQQKAAGS